MSEIILSLVLGMWSLQATTNFCDPRLVQPEKDPNGYRQRGDRCEGLFIQQVSGSASLLVASFHEAFAEFDARSGLDLRLDWVPAAASEPTWLRAYGLRRRQYYRMDAQRPPGGRSYLWPTTVLGNLNLSKPFLGVIAWNDVKVGSESRRVHLPLRIGGQKAATRPNAYELVLVSDIELTEVTLTLAVMNRDGQPVRHVMLNRPLGYGYYPAEQGITIPISGLSQSGLHRLGIAVNQRNGGGSNTEVWFYHPGT